MPKTPNINEDRKEYIEARMKHFNSRSAAAEASDGCLTERIIEGIETGTREINPTDVVAMAKTYNKPYLCRYYCSHDCDIGQEYLPEPEATSLPQITLGMLATLNTLVKEKDRMIEIAADGKITEDEMDDFRQIQSELEEMSLAIDSLKLWVENALAQGNS